MRKIILLVVSNYNFGLLSAAVIFIMCMNALSDFVVAVMITKINAVATSGAVLLCISVHTS